MASAVSCTVTVTVPPAGIVSEPWIVVPLMTKALVLAPALAVLPRLMALPNCPPTGNTSAKLAPISADGPALLIAKLNVVVAPLATVLVLLSLATLKVTAGETVSVSAAVQVPLLQEGAEFVLVTLTGGEMTAVLVTCVCA